MEPEEYESIFRLEATHWWYRGMRESAEALLDRYLPTRSDLKILDAGCGTGGNLVSLSRLGQTVGLDYSPLALGFCRQRKLDRLVRASVTHVPLGASSFDLVTSFEVLYHAAVSDDVLALREFQRVLRPGGLLLLRLPAFEFLRGAHDKTVHTRHRYTAAEVGRKLRQAGLEPLRLTYANSLLFPVAAAERVAQRISGKAEEGGSDVGETAGWLNSLLLVPLRIEARLLPWVNLPVGLSVLALARKPLSSM
jgi:ubiquinone/menaquinone biosynthesis C-methylase UbiE